ncbi:MAG: hypothetical protein WCJ61_11660, partial [Paludibacter sp.]
GALDSAGYNLTSGGNSISGSGVSGSGVLLNSANSAVTITGNVTLASASTINTSGGTSSQITFSGIATTFSSSDFIKIGSGTVVLAATTSITANWLIQEGTLSTPSVAGNLQGRPLYLGSSSTIGTLLKTSGGGNTALSIYTNAGGGIYDFSETGLQQFTLSTGTNAPIALNGNLNVKFESGYKLEFLYGFNGTGGFTVTQGTSSVGSLVLSAANTYSGATTINGDTLRLGATNAIPSGSAVTINGGTLSTNGFSSGSTSNTGTLTIGNNGGTIALKSSGTESLYFANSSAVTWGSGTLTIMGWSGAAGSTGTKGKIFVGSTSGALIAGQLAKINFSGFGSGATILSTGEIVPVPGTSNATDLFKSLTSGNWNSASSWQSSSDAGATWGAATLVPGSSASGITIQSGHTITLDVSPAIGSAKTLTINGTLIAGTYILSGTGGNISIASTGILKTANTTGILGTITATGTITFTSGSTIEFNNLGTVTTPQSLNPGSLDISGVNIAVTGTAAGTNTVLSLDVSGKTINSLIVNQFGSLNLNGMTLTTSSTSSLNGSGHTSLNSNIGDGAITNGSATSATLNANLTTSATNLTKIKGNTGLITVNGNIVTGGAEFQLAGTATTGVTVNGIISGGSIITKGGNTALTLAGANTFSTSNMNINAGGSLTLAATNALPVKSSNTATLDFLGTITFNLGNYNLGTSTSNTAGILWLNLASSSVPIYLGSNNNNTYYFAAANGQAWNSTHTMVIYNWTGTGGVTGSGNKIYVGSTSSGLTATQLGQISFNGYTVTPGSRLLSTGELVPNGSIATDYFRSNTTTGNWSSASSWQSSPDGSTNWITATAIPTSSATGINIQSGHTISVDAASSATSLTIAGTLSFSGTNTLTIATGGTLTNSGTFTAGAGTVAFAGTGTITGTSLPPVSVSTSGATIQKDELVIALATNAPSSNPDTGWVHPANYIEVFYEILKQDILRFI